MRRYESQVKNNVTGNDARLKAAATNSRAKQKSRRDAGATKPGAALLKIADKEATGVHSVITDFTRFLGRSTSQPFRTA
jgi:hypothetical protein